MEYQVSILKRILHSGLPVDLGGYVRVRFSSDSVMTYPACCIVTRWSTLQKQTRLEGLSIARMFFSTLKTVFGDENVGISYPQQQQPKSCVLLPASALLDGEHATWHDTIDTRVTKRLATSFQ
jgi:hypothetical protein